MRYIDRLIELCEQARAISPRREFVLQDLDELSNIKTAIYVIEEIGGDPIETFLQFSKYRDTRQRKCAKLNSPSPIMYVGSSTTGVKNRIQQHQGTGYHGTYALHMSHWFVGQCQITVKEYDCDRDVIQIVEDDLSDALQPAFGKRGGNEK